MALIINPANISNLTYPLTTSPSVTDTSSSLTKDTFVESARTELLAQYEEEKTERFSLFNETETQLTDEFSDRETKLAENFNNSEAKQISLYDAREAEKIAGFNEEEAEYQADFDREESILLARFEKSEERILNSVKRSLGVRSDYDPEGDERFNSYFEEAAERKADYDTGAAERQAEYDSEAEERLTAFNEQISSKRSGFEAEIDAERLDFEQESSERLKEFEEASAGRYESFYATEASLLQEFNDTYSDLISDYDSTAETLINRYNEQKQDRLNELYETENDLVENYDRQEDLKVENYAFTESQKQAIFDENESEELAQLQSTPDNELTSLNLTEEQRLQIFNNNEADRLAISEIDEYQNMVEDLFEHGLPGDYDISGDERFAEYQANIQESTLTVNTPENIEDGDTVQITIGSGDSAITVKTDALSKDDDSSAIAQALKTAIDSKIDDGVFTDTILSKDAVSIVDNVLTITGKDSNADVTISDYTFNESTANDLTSTAGATYGNLTKSVLTINTPSNIETGDTVTIEIGTTGGTGGIEIESDFLMEGDGASAIALALKSAIDDKIDEGGSIAELINSKDDVVVNGNELTIYGKDSDIEIAFKDYSFTEHVSTDGGDIDFGESIGTLSQDSLTIDTAANIQEGNKVSITIGDTTGTEGVDYVTVTSAGLNEGAGTSDVAQALKTAIDAAIDSGGAITNLIADKDDVSVNGSTLSIIPKNTTADVTIDNYQLTTNEIDVDSDLSNKSILVDDFASSIFSDAQNIESGDTVKITFSKINSQGETEEFSLETEALAEGATGSDITDSIKSALETELSDYGSELYNYGTFELTAGSLTKFTANDSDVSVDYSVQESNVTTGTGSVDTTTVNSNSTKGIVLEISDTQTTLEAGDRIQFTLYSDNSSVTITTEAFGGTNPDSESIPFAIYSKLYSKITDSSDHDLDDIIGSSFDVMFSQSQGVSIENNKLTIYAKDASTNIGLFENLQVKKADDSLVAVDTDDYSITYENTQESLIKIEDADNIEDGDTVSIIIGDNSDGKVLHTDYEKITTAPLSAGATEADIAEALRDAIYDVIDEGTSTYIQNSIEDKGAIGLNGKILTIAAKEPGVNVDITYPEDGFWENSTIDGNSTLTRATTNDIDQSILEITDAEDVEDSDTATVRVGNQTAGVENTDYILVTTDALSKGDDEADIATAIKDAIIAQKSGTNYYTNNIGSMAIEDGKLTITGKDKDADVGISITGTNDFDHSESSTATSPAATEIKRAALSFTPTAIEFGDTVKVTIGADSEGAGGVTVESGPLESGATASDVATALKQAIDSKINNPYDYSFDSLIESTDDVRVEDGQLIITPKSGAEVDTDNFFYNTEFTEYDNSGDTGVQNGTLSTSSTIIGNEVFLFINEASNVEDGDTVKVTIGADSEGNGGVEIETQALSEGATASDVAAALKAAIDEQITNNHPYLTSLIGSTDNTMAVDGILYVKTTLDSPGDNFLYNPSLNEDFTKESGASTASFVSQETDIQKSVLSINSAQGIEDGDTFYVNVGDINVTTSALSTGDSASDVVIALKEAIDEKINDPNDHDFDSIITSTSDVIVDGDELSIKTQGDVSDVVFSNYGFNEVVLNNSGESTAETSQDMITSSRAQFNIDSYVRRQDFEETEHTTRFDYLTDIESDRLDFELGAANARENFIEELVDDRNDFIEQQDDDREDFVQNEEQQVQSYQKRLINEYQKIAAQI